MLLQILLISFKDFYMWQKSIQMKMRFVMQNFPIYLYVLFGQIYFSW